jgi:hypothetical protein
MDGDLDDRLSGALLFPLAKSETWNCLGHDVCSRVAASFHFTAWAAKISRRPNGS